VGAGLGRACPAGDKSRSSAHSQAVAVAVSTRVDEVQLGSTASGLHAAATTLVRLYVAGNLTAFCVSMSP
jgi:hypothetical protein